FNRAPHGAPLRMGRAARNELAMAAEGVEMRMTPNAMRNELRMTTRHCSILCLLGGLLVGANVCTAQESNIPARAVYQQVVSELRPFIEQEMAKAGTPALSTAIVDDQQIVWAQGFGMADPKTKTLATAETVYRIGSVSKLFTDIGVMQLVERGK